DAVASSFPAMAFWFGGDTAQRAASWALHVHGGYGFMEEYDVQLYFRRAKAARLLLGDPKRELQLLAERLWSDPGSGPVPGSLLRPTSAYGDVDEPGGAEADEAGGFDFRLGADELGFRREVREFLGANVTPEIIERAHHTGT